jgi:mycothiol synthase
LTLKVSPARAEERSEALRLFFHDLPEEQREARVKNALTLLANGELSADGLLVCRDGENLIGTIGALPLPGAAGLIYPPQAVGTVSRETAENMLLDTAIAWLRQRGAKFAQALLSAGEAASAGPLQRRGFTHITTLLYLEKLLADADQFCNASSSLDLETYAACDSQAFHNALIASYEGSLDCPEINGLRSAEDIVAGYRAVPGCRLERWWLARYQNTPVGVLITAASQEPATWELLYIGLVPAARRQGFGMELTRAAMAQARAAAAARLILTVDRRNLPAQRMYASLGFEQYERREVYMAFFGS